MGINRQQFNKYLTGLHLPSTSNLQIIANFFKIGHRLLFSAHDEFRTIVDGNYFSVMEKIRGSAHFDAFMKCAFLGRRSVEGLAGVYDRYQYSSIYRGHILRSAHCIYWNADILQHVYIERFPSMETPNTADYVFKYHGLTVPLADRVHMFDFESIQKNEMTTAVLTPVQRNATRFMCGIATGVAATMFRQPFATRVVLHYRRRGLISKEDLKKVTTLEPRDPTIPREAMQFLGAGNDMLLI